jgi:hypothetical protein
VVAALGLPCTSCLPPAALLHALQTPLRRVSQLLCGPAKASQGTRAAAAAARKAVQLLANVAAAAPPAEGACLPEAHDQALLLVLQFAAPVRRALKVRECVCT